MFWVLCDHETMVWRQTKSLPMSNVRQRMSRRSSCPGLAVGIQCLFFCCLISYLFRVPAVADEPILIAEILASPESYHLDLVTVQGTVRHVERLLPYRVADHATDWIDDSREFLNQMPARPVHPYQQTQDGVG